MELFCHLLNQIHMKDKTHRYVIHIVNVIKPLAHCRTQTHTHIKRESAIKREVSITNSMDLCHTCREVGRCCSNNSFSPHHESTKNSMNPKGMLSLGQVKGFLNPSLGPVQLRLGERQRHFLVNAWELLQNCLEVRRSASTRA